MQGGHETDFAKRWFVGAWLALLGLKLWLAARPGSTSGGNTLSALVVWSAAGKVWR